MMSKNMVNIGTGKRLLPYQCWLTIGKVLWYFHRNNLKGNALDINPWYQFGKLLIQYHNRISKGPTSPHMAQYNMVLDNLEMKF